MNTSGKGFSAKKSSSKTKFFIRRKKYAILFGLAFFVFLLFTSSLIVSPEAGGSDSAGYLLNSKIILGKFPTQNLTPTIMPKSNCGALDQMLTSRLSVNSKCTSFDRHASYPVGFGILHAVSTLIFGDNDFGRTFSEAFTFTGILFLLYIFIFYTTKKVSLALLGPFLYAVSKTSLFCLNSNLSDGPGAFWNLAATFASFVILGKSLEKTFKHHLMLAGYTVVIWFAVLTREINALCILILFAVYLRFNKSTKIFVLLYFFITGIPFLYLRHKLLGTWFSPSYGTGIFNAISPKWFLRGLGNELYFLASSLGVLLLVLFFPRLKWSFMEKIMLVQVFVMFMFYSFYQWSGETWWDSRFVISVFPILIVLVLTRYSEFHSKYLTKRTLTKLHFQSKTVVSVLAVALVASLLVANSLVHFSGASSPYRYLLFEAPKFRAVEPVVEFIAKNVPTSSTIVTMDFSAAGRYYFADRYRFLWQPELETFSREEIVKSFPKTYWVYNYGYVSPPISIKAHLQKIAQIGSEEIDVLE
jgi:hypothetical protein